MKVTVCELPDDRVAFEIAWRQLANHVREHGSDLVLLPEMPFAEWMCADAPFSSQVWDEAVTAHEQWAGRVGELAPAPVLYTAPTHDAGRRFNRAICALPSDARLYGHAKRYLPDEAGFWEASWYHRGDGDFAPISVSGASVGVQICTELWMFELARAYGRQGATLIATPRATPDSSLDAWLVAGRAAAISAGAFCLSSNRAQLGPRGMRFGGGGWVIDPSGQVLARTTADIPILTIEIDLSVAVAAKQSYPRYVT